MQIYCIQLSEGCQMLMDSSRIGEEFLRLCRWATQFHVDDDHQHEYRKNRRMGGKTRP